MKLDRCAMALCGLLAVGGCATNYSTKTAAEVAAQVRVVDSEFDTTRALFSPPLSGDTDGFGSPMYELRLATVQQKATGAITHAVVVEWTYVAGSWQFFSKPTLPGGQACAMSVGNRSVRTCNGAWCTYVESTTVQLPSGALASGSELRIRFASTGGFRTLTVPATYIDGHLQGTAKLTRASSKAAS